MHNAFAPYFDRLVPSHFADLDALAAHCSVRRKFVHALYRGEAPRGQRGDAQLEARLDPRYCRIDAMFRAHGVTGFLDAAITAHQNGHPQHAPTNQRAEETFQHVYNLVTNRGHPMTRAVQDALVHLLTALNTA